MFREGAEKVLAVSGGIDSMVMLDIFQHDNVKVAHFNHGTRPSANDDMNFVSRVADERYGLAEHSVCCVANLGEEVSEEMAREKRYSFLRLVARAEPMTEGVQLKALSTQETSASEIYTAHHLNDLVESVAINLLRGTGWRGLAVLDTPGVRRPFLEPEVLPKELRRLAPFNKKAIHKYAVQHRIVFRQDPTNSEDHYLRNRLRRKLEDFDEKEKLYILWQEQKKLKSEIDQLVQGLLPPVNQPWQRSWFQDLDEKVALELLRAGTLRVGISATRPQLEGFRQAILTYGSGKYFNLPGDKLVRFSKMEFYL